MIEGFTLNNFRVMTMGNDPRSTQQRGHNFLLTNQQESATDLVLCLLNVRALVEGSNLRLMPARPRTSDTKGISLHNARTMHSRVWNPHTLRDSAFHHNEMHCSDCRDPLLGEKQIIVFRNLSECRKSEKWKSARQRH